MIQDGEFLRVTCKLSYHGNLAPQFTWSTPDDTIISNATTFRNSTHTYSHIDMPAFPTLMTSFACKTYFNGPTASPPFLTVPDLNPPSFTSVYHSPALIVICKYGKLMSWVLW